MVASYVGIDSAGPAAGAQSISSLSPPADDVLVLHASGYDSGAGAPPHIYADATVLADFSSILFQGETASAGGKYTVAEIRDRIADGGEPASYTMTADSNAYGYFRAMVQLSGAQIQSSSAAVYSEIGNRDVPAFTVDNDDSVAVGFATSYSKAVLDGLWTGDGWTSRASLDGGFFHVFTRSVAAGSFALVSGAGGDADAMSMIVVYEPIPVPSSFVAKFHDGAVVRTASSLGVHDGSVVKPVNSIVLA